MSDFTPEAIVQELDKHIIGQKDAKRAVAIALRNRWRRSQVADELRDEITPKNILMIGPTGVGKTEIARRLAKLAQAPFIKVEATKFTEVGYVGREVDSIIRDLANSAIKMTREIEVEKVHDAAVVAAEDRILDALLPAPRKPREALDEQHDEDEEDEEIDVPPPPPRRSKSTRAKFRKMLHEGKLDDREVDIETSGVPVGVEIVGPPGMEEMTNQLQGLFQNMGTERSKKRKLRVKDALKLLTDEEAHKRINEEDLRLRAVERVEQHGIVFIDEIDKVASNSEGRGADISREGVQRDLLPLVEGCTVSTKYGSVKTDHILFIASGAFHLSKPSDLIPELQGRLPIRVELGALSSEDFVRILTEPDASLTEQYVALLATEDFTLTFDDSGIKRIADIAWHVNETTENIGARRLHTVLERLLEEVSFHAPTQEGREVLVDADYVNQHLSSLLDNEDLTRYIL